MTEHSVGRMTILHVELPDKTAHTVAEITIDCPACGRFIYQVAGHHFKMLRDMMNEALEVVPSEDSDNETHVVKRDRASFTGRPDGGGNPRDN